MNQQRRRITIDTTHTPDALRDRELWVLWDVTDKMALAPWQTGHMYRAGWSKASGKDPRTDYATAKAVADLPPERIHESYPFPDGPPAKVKATPLLKQAEAREKPHITFVDYDDVVVDGFVSAEVWGLVEDFAGPVFLSSSGTGLHQWVYGDLPDGLGKFDESLHTEGSIEMYDHARMTGSTWRHVNGTALDELEEATAVIENVVEEYGRESHFRRMGKAAAGHEEKFPEAKSVSKPPRQNSNSAENSAYYDLDVETVARDDTSFNHHAKNTRGSQLEGPHPEHGPQHSTVEKCTNFGVETSENVWKCWAHDDGGGGLALVAVMQVPGVSCGSSRRVYNDAERLLKACLHARDDYNTLLEDEKPPYKALLAVAEKFDIEIANEATGLLGESAYNVCRRIYDDLAPGDV